MARTLLDLTEAPQDPIRRLLWLSGVMDEVKAELDTQFQRTYYEARVEQRIESAFDLKLHARARILKWTRQENEARGRTIRWGDGY